MGDNDGEVARSRSRGRRGTSTPLSWLQGLENLQARGASYTSSSVRDALPDINIMIAGAQMLLDESTCTEGPLYDFKKYCEETEEPFLKNLIIFVMELQDTLAEELSRTRLSLPRGTTEFLEKIASPRDWQPLAVGLALLFMSRGATVSEGIASGLRLYKIDVSPGAGKTVFSMWVALLARKLKFVERIVVFAGASDRVKEQWENIANTLFLSERQRRIRDSRGPVCMIYTQQVLDRDIAIVQEQLGNCVISTLRRGKILIVVDEAHHLSLARGQNSRGVRLLALLRSGRTCDSPCILLTGTDLPEGDSLLGCVPKHFFLSWQQARSRNWVLPLRLVEIKVEMEQIEAGGIYQPSLEDMKPLLVTPYALRKTSDELARSLGVMLLREPFRDCLRNLQAHENGSSPAPGKLLCFVPARNGKFGDKLKETEQDIEELFDKYAQVAWVGACQDISRSGYVPQRGFPRLKTYWALACSSISHGRDLKAFAEKTPNTSEIYICFTCAQASEGFDDDGVDHIIFALGIDTKLSTAQMANRGTRPRSEDYAYLREHNRFWRACLVYILEQDTRRKAHMLPFIDGALETRTINQTEIPANHTPPRQSRVFGNKIQVLNELLIRIESRNAGGLLGSLYVTWPEEDTRKDFAQMSRMSDEILWTWASFENGSEAVRLFKEDDDMLRRRHHIGTGMRVPERLERTWRNRAADNATEPSRPMVEIASWGQVADTLRQAWRHLRLHLARRYRLEESQEEEIKLCEKAAFLIFCQTKRHLRAFLRSSHSALSADMQPFQCRSCSNILCENISTSNFQSFRMESCLACDSMRYLSQGELRAWFVVLLPARIDAVFFNRSQNRDRVIQALQKAYDES